MVAFSASELLGNSKYSQCSFWDVLNKFTKESIVKIMKKYNKKNNNINITNNVDYITQCLINQLDNINLEGEDKKLVEFINRMSNLELNKKDNIKEEEKQNEDNNYINLEFNQEYFFLNQGNDINYKINGITYDKNNIKGINNFMDPEIILQSFNTNIKINYGYQNYKNDIGYNYIIFYDNKLFKEGRGMIPKKIKKEFINNIIFLTKKYCLNDLICEQIADYFNIEIKPKSNNFIKFKKYVIYEKEEKDTDNNKIIINDIAPSFSPLISAIPNKRILQAFTHFSYQVTYGELIITDLNLDKNNGKINDYNIYFLKENGYSKILEFFSSHVCDDICKYLGLVHPRKKKNPIEINEQFYNRKYTINYKLCKCCSIPIKISNNENYCCKCIYEKNKTIRKKKCQDCHALFDYSSYEYNSELINYPIRCKKCIKIF